MDDGEYVNNIAEKIPVWLAEGSNELSDSRSIWDWMKYNIRVHSFRKENEREKEEEYVKAKHNYESEPNDLNVNILNSVKDTMELFYEKKVKAIIIRARARWHEQGEKSTKYFLNLERHIRNI